MTSKLKYLAAGAAVVAVCATAALAGTLHHMTVSLPGGGSENITYSGDVAPRVIFLTPQMVRDRQDVRVWSPFVEMDRVSAVMDAMAADMDRQMQVSMQQARQMQRLAPGMTNADLQALPAGTQSYSVTTISTGSGVCTRSVQVTSSGAGMKPQMVSHSSGCGDDAAPSADAPRLNSINAMLHDPAVPHHHI